MANVPESRQDRVDRAAALSAPSPTQTLRETAASAAAAVSCDPNVFAALVEEFEEDAAFTLDDQGCVTSWNAGAERLWGYRPEEVRGEPFSRFFTAGEPGQQEPSEQLREAAAAGRSEYEAKVLRQDGSQFDGKVVTKALRDEAGQLYGFVALTRDVTGRKKAEAALAESENRFRAFMDNSSAVNFVEDDRGRLTYVDRTFERRFGIAARVCLGATVFDLWPEDVARPLHEHSLDVLKDEEPREWIQRVPTSLGPTLWLVCKFPFCDAAGQRFVGVTAFDITEHERAKQEIETLNSELEQRVAERTAELERTNQELRAFSYSVSHDLRAPLRAIDGFSQALLDDYGEQLDDMGLDFLQRVRAEAQRMGQLMDDLLQLFRVSRTELCRSPVDLSEIARGIGDELRRQQPHRQVEFRIESGLVAEGDERLLRVVMENLLENAWKFTSTRDQARIEFGQERLPNGELAWRVRDNGVGFDMAYAERLFGAFQRLHSDTEFSGTGIGLATVQRIVHRHGGRLWAEAAVDCGATFYFTL